MSIALMTRVFATTFEPIELNGVSARHKKGGHKKQRRVSGVAQKVVMLALADAANDEGESAYPSITTLIQKTNLTLTPVAFTLKALRQEKYIFKKGISTRGTSNYSINLHLLSDGYKKAPLLREQRPHSSGSRGPSPQGVEEPLLPEETTHTTPILSPTPTTIQAAGAVKTGEWSLSDLLQAGKVPSKRIAQLAACSPRAYVAYYLYGLTQPTIKHPALWAAKKISEPGVRPCGQPFDTLAATPAAAEAVLNWMHTEDWSNDSQLNGLHGPALAFRGWLPKGAYYSAIAQKALNELGLTLREPEQRPTEVYEREPEPEKDKWHQLLDQLTGLLPSNLVRDHLRQLAFVDFSSGVYTIGVSKKHEMAWLINRNITEKMSTFANVKFVEVDQ